MTVSEITVKMIGSSQSNRHDIEHFLKVHAYARLIGEQEGLTPEEQTTLEVAAVLHDIAVPLCRAKYGCAEGKHQELEGGPLARAFLQDTGLSQTMVDRVVYLVAHHHTLTGVDGRDYQILLEADYLVNASESSYSESNIRNTLDCVFKTAAGIALLKSVYGL